MKPLLDLLFFCCRGKKEEESTVISKKDSKELEKIEKNTNDLKFASLEDLSNKELENNTIELKASLKIRQPRHKPSIVLSIDGSSQQVVLFEDKIKKKKRKPKKSKKRHSKNPVAQ